MTAPVRPVPRCEMDVLLAMAAGRTLAQIATEWGVERGTVHTFAARLRRRLGAETNPHAVFLACQAGLLDGRPQHHGDHNGYEAHIRRGDRGDEICDDCRAGEKAYRAGLREARNAQKAPESLRDAPRSPSPTPVR